VLRLGAPPASKVVARWLAGSGARQVAVDARGRWWDAERTAGEVLAADPTELCRALATSRIGPAADPAWLGAWRAAEDAAQRAVDGCLAGHPEPTEPGLARALAAALPDGATLVVSSSMPVRDVEWFAAPRTGLRVVANRGANGIDGVVSTAVGVALAGGPTAVLVGDVAFLHDANALLGAPGRGIDLAVVVVDNDGGGIFSFLPQAGALPADRFERLFGTPHGADPCALAAAWGVPAARLDRLADLPAALAGDGVRLVHVRTDRAANVAVHDEVHAAVAAAVSRSA
jgi:2-succinyl-5-enolpyruvyl-6-hydroxy-3-cyclohexene-1-carboxylate synthase